MSLYQANEGGDVLLAAWLGEFPDFLQLTLIGLYLHFVLLRVDDVSPELDTCACLELLL